LNVSAAAQNGDLNEIKQKAKMVLLLDIQTRPVHAEKCYKKISFMEAGLFWT